MKQNQQIENDDQTPNDSNQKQCNQFENYCCNLCGEQINSQFSNIQNQHIFHKTCLIEYLKIQNQEIVEIPCQFNQKQINQKGLNEVGNELKLNQFNNETTNIQQQYQNNITNENNQVIYGPFQKGFYPARLKYTVKCPKCKVEEITENLSRNYLCKNCYNKFNCFCEKQSQHLDDQSCHCDSPPLMKKILNNLTKFIRPNII